MENLLKNIYTPIFFDRFTDAVSDVIVDFDKTLFLAKIYDSSWEQRELKQRMKHIAATLHEFLPNTYDGAISSIKQIITAIRKRGTKEMSLEYMFFPEYIEIFGINHFNTSVDALEFVTQFTSCEFAVRPFMIQYHDDMIVQMTKWSKHESHLVRRFSSEGARPRLPWAMALPALKKDPTDILPILDNLKDDASEFVRRSVANNLNDIAKDHPDVVLATIIAWKGTSSNTDWVIKHGSRTLLKKAHPEVLAFFGLEKVKDVEISALALQNDQISIGDSLLFSFELINKNTQPVKLRLEYGIDYMKANGKQNRKLFKITENTYEPNKVYTFNRTQTFRDMTTRKHYLGVHRITILINGQEFASHELQVI